VHREYGRLTLATAGLLLSLCSRLDNRALMTRFLHDVAYLLYRRASLNFSETSNRASPTLNLFFALPNLLIPRLKMLRYFHLFSAQTARKLFELELLVQFRFFWSELRLGVDQNGPEPKRPPRMSKTAHVASPEQPIKGPYTPFNLFEPVLLNL